MQQLTDDDRSKLIRLFTYIRELSQLRFQMVWDLSRYDQVLWFHDIPSFEGLIQILPSTDNSVLCLAVKRPLRKAPPSIPDSFQAWIDVSQWKNNKAELSLLDAPLTHELEPRVDSASDTWLEFHQQWMSWAAEDRQFETIENLYKQLFIMHDKAQKAGETYELLIGLGLLTWARDAATRIRRHVISFKPDIRFDALLGEIHISLSRKGFNLHLEQEILRPEHRPSQLFPETWDAEEQAWKDINPFRSDTLPKFLQRWVQSIHPGGLYSDDWQAPTEMSSEPSVHWAPALIFRRRSQRSLIQVHEDILQLLATAEQIPGCALRLIGPPALTSDPAMQKPLDPDSIMFPLPANREQIQIAEKLQVSDGVIVQGPPGTGKSHSIVNLVSHLLAQGKRVLVTSHTSRALKVLKEKFPEEISALCVSLVGEDSESMNILEGSIKGMTDRFQQWDASKNSSEIQSMQKNLQQIRKQKEQISAKIRELREDEITHSMDRFRDYTGTRAAIIQRYQEEKSRHAWLEDRPHWLDAFPIESFEVEELIILQSQVSPQVQKLPNYSFPDWSELFAEDDVLQAMKQLNLAQEHLKTPLSQGPSVLLPSCLSMPQESLTKAQSLLKELEQELRTLHFQNFDFVNSFIQSSLQGSFSRLKDTAAASSVLLDSLKANSRSSLPLQVEGIQSAEWQEAHRVADELIQDLKNGAQWHWGPFASPAVRSAKKLIERVRVDGRKIGQSIDEWIQFRDLCHFNSKMRQLQILWQELCPLDPLAQSLTLQHIDRLQDTLLKVLTWIDRSVPLQIEFSASRLDWTDPEAILNLEQAIGRALWEKQRHQAQQSLQGAMQSFKNLLQSDTHPIYQAFLEVLETQAIDQFPTALKQLQAAYRQHKQLLRAQDLYTRLSSKAPRLAERIRKNRLNAEMRTQIQAIDKAWEWWQVDRWLRDTHAAADDQYLRHRLDLCEVEERLIIRGLVAAKAWGSSLGSMTEDQRQHLIAWSKAMRKIGSGKGKYADQHRQKARESMTACQSAIPAWIMPLHKVAETMQAGLHQFDVILIDEASQSGPESLFLYLFGDRIVVVGDDKQISPDNVGLDRGAIEEMRRMHIADLPHSSHIGIDDSLFDLAEILYSHRIILREHFRCMPAIIQFSNELCYQHAPLIPLKQYGSQRLEPVIVTKHTGDARQESSGQQRRNIKEAEALVNALEQCSQDPHYAGKTFGVISLLGETQARLIEGMLLSRIGPEEFRRRELVCGDAYAFQGDERDVIFLSLVVSAHPTHRIRSLTGARYERRFNVAMSRAKDQLWLFHSFGLEDVRPPCLRYRLLSHCLRKQQPHGLLLNDGELKPFTLAEDVDRKTHEPPPPFDSWFECDVYQAIRARNYRVIPQFEVAGRRIDLVVQGANKSLAIECDGDWWHGPEQFEADLARQRDLERCGWQFWRLRYSSFLFDREDAMKSLWPLLDELGIEPRQISSQDIPGDLFAVTDLYPKKDAKANVRHQSGDRSASTD